MSRGWSHNEGTHPTGILVLFATPLNKTIEAINPDPNSYCIP